MKQPKQQIREATVAEIVARAYDLRRRKEGSSRRVSFTLPPNLIPPPRGEYETGFGTVKIFSKFLVEDGRWLVEVKFPPEGFTVADHMPSPTKQQLQQLSQPPSSAKPAQPQPPTPSAKTPSSQDYLEITREFIAKLKSQL
ncbi:MAG: hypothetical protein GU346_06715 [Thermocrinis sp.]|jgi:hypothetical protein|nr:hypothetical protein [Thermocrinis sp.]